MQTLRNHSQAVARLMLVWFVLFIGASIASPIVAPTDVQMACLGSGGMKIITTGDDGDTVVKFTTSMDCPLCASMPAISPTLRTSFFKSIPLAHALQPIAAAHIASVTAPPFLSRGPPHISL